ncbi:hypothetical protein K402DRAFT_233550 [Aulographum hederae CBS 113979]|uniref:Uncharacterized protein n=1 Tax=Aulographum hederae CBS 113979 TaxID=1176131 RepID=A0A6G1GLC3_9PEZI|nr:hypothetical protein K402DRAFT_233550 [Aulographum hederae CBS 113979]
MQQQNTSIALYPLIFPLCSQKCSGTPARRAGLVINLALLFFFLHPFSHSQKDSQLRCLCPPSDDTTRSFSFFRTFPPWKIMFTEAEHECEKLTTRPNTSIRTSRAGLGASS